MPYSEGFIETNLFNLIKDWGDLITVPSWGENATAFQSDKERSNKYQ